MDLFVIGVAELQTPRRFVWPRAITGTWDHERKVFYNPRYFGATCVYSIMGLRAQGIVCDWKSLVLWEIMGPEIAGTWGFRGIL